MNDNNFTNNLKSSVDRKGLVKNKTDLLKTGEEIGGYRVIKLLGAGGMGQVYLAENIQMHKHYALKVLPPNLSKSKNFVDRFRVEARVMADLKHPNIVGVHNTGYDEERGLYYLVMEFIDGRQETEDQRLKTEDGREATVETDYVCLKLDDTPSDLEELLKEKKQLPEEYVLKIAKQLCSALDYAHNFRGEGIVHRDLKPSNILLDADGNGHIADFGLAKVIGQDYLKDVVKHSTKLTMVNNNLDANPANMSIGDMNTMVEGETSSTLKPSNVQHSTAAGTGSVGSLIGTYEYMSPEQQDYIEATAQSDIYSLGLIIYRMLTGLKIKGKWKSPSECGCSEEWDVIINKCLEQNPKDRFKSAAVILPLLQQISDKIFSSKKIKNTPVTKNRFNKKRNTIILFFIILIIILTLIIFLNQEDKKEQKIKKAIPELPAKSGSIQEPEFRQKDEQEKQAENVTAETVVKRNLPIRETDIEIKEYQPKSKEFAERGSYEKAVPLQVKAKQAIIELDSIVFLDGIGKKQIKLQESIKDDYKIGNDFFDSEKYDSCLIYFYKVIKNTKLIVEIEKQYSENRNKGVISLTKYDGEAGMGFFQEAMKYKNNKNIEKLQLSAKNIIQKKHKLDDEFNELKNFIRNSKYYSTENIASADSNEVMDFCNNCLSKISELNKLYNIYMSKGIKDELKSIESKILNIKSKILLIPKDLFETKPVAFPSTYGLETGSSEAMLKQKNAAKKINMPVEVQTVKYGIKMRLIPADTFIMGSPSSESHRDSDETQHAVSLTKPFYIGIYEVTQRQWKDIMGTAPSYFNNVGENAPVEKVSWKDSQNFLEKLCEKLEVPKGTYRLPTEAEWEYSCRAGTTGKYYAPDIDSIAWYGYTKEGKTTHPVDMKKTNAFGLYDMSGNVWEWCSDFYGSYPTAKTVNPTGPVSGTKRVNRGGRWGIEAAYSRSSSRRKVSDTIRKNDLGFRIVRSL